MDQKHILSPILQGMILQLPFLAALCHVYTRILISAVLTPPVIETLPGRRLTVLVIFLTKSLVSLASVGERGPPPCLVGDAVSDPPNTCNWQFVNTCLHLQKKRHIICVVRKYNTYCLNSSSCSASNVKAFVSIIADTKVAMSHYFMYTYGLVA